MTRTVRDAAGLLDAVHGPGVGDKYTAPPPARRYAAVLTVAPERLRVAAELERAMPWAERVAPHAIG